MRNQLYFLLLTSTLLVLSCGPGPMAPLELNGVWHRVKSGDTVQGIADQHGADPREMAELNDLPEDGTIGDRGELFVPTADGGPPGTGASPPPAIVVAAPKKPAAAGAQPRSAKKCGVDGRPCLVWPVAGELGARFGSGTDGHHDGIDIIADRGTAISAAAAGKVIYVGDDIKGYGNMVIIRHEEGLITVYAHCEETLAAEGSEVKAGQAIAKVGSSGNATSPQLHFEVRVGESPRDPLSYLPER